MKNLYKIKNIWLICTLLLVIFFSHIKIFNNLINTFYGKIVFFVLLIYLSTINNIFIIIAILSIIIIFNFNKSSLLTKNNILRTKYTIENFNLIDTESTLKRGKQSLAIPVDPFMGKARNIQPFDCIKHGKMYSAII